MPAKSNIFLFTVPEETGSWYEYLRRHFARRGLVLHTVSVTDPTVDFTASIRNKLEEMDAVLYLLGYQLGPLIPEDTADEPISYLEYTVELAEEARIQQYFILVEPGGELVPEELPPEPLARAKRMQRLRASAKKSGAYLGTVREVMDLRDAAAKFRERLNPESGQYLLPMISLAGLAVVGALAWFTWFRLAPREGNRSDFFDKPAVQAPQDVGQLQQLVGPVESHTAPLPTIEASGVNNAPPPRGGTLEAAGSKEMPLGLNEYEKLIWKGNAFLDSNDVRSCVELIRPMAEALERASASQPVLRGQLAHLTARALMLENRIQEAEILLEKNLDQARDTLGQEHPTYHLLEEVGAELSCARGYYAQALPSLQRIWQRRQAEATTGSLLKLRYNLASALVSVEQPQEALPHLEECHRQSLATYGQYHPQTIAIKQALENARNATNSSVAPNSPK